MGLCLTASVNAYIDNLTVQTDMLNTISNPVCTVNQIYLKDCSPIKINTILETFALSTTLDEKLNAWCSVICSIARAKSCFGGGYWDNWQYWNNDDSWNNGL